MIKINELVMETMRLSNKLSIDLINKNGKVEIFVDVVTPENNVTINIYDKEQLRELKDINVLDMGKVTKELENIINSIDNNLNNWSYEVSRDSSLSSPIKAIRYDRGVYFTNIWGDIDLMPRCFNISSNTEFTDLMVINQYYSMEELLKLAKDNKISKYTIEAIEYLKAV